MPRVTQEHLASRRRQIVDAALRTFSRQGFHQTSMQDVIAESGLSAGAVYRYFPSKAALVVEATTDVLGAADEALRQLHRTDGVVHPAYVVDLLLSTLLEASTRTPGVDLSRIAVSAWAEALRDEDVAAVAREVYQRLRGILVDAVRAWQQAGHLALDVDPETAGQVLFSHLPGFLLQRLLIGDVDPGRYARALEALLGGPDGRPADG